MARVTTILVIDDDARFRAQAQALLESDGFAVTGTATDGAAGLEAVRSLRPDVVLLDIGLPDLDGFEVARLLALSQPAPLVVLTSSRDARSYGRRLLHAGVLGFVPKERLSGAAIRALVDGG
jgi:DNA-binding NarL/FixJ family response regulator